MTAAEEAHSASADLNGSGQATEDDVDVGAAGNGGDIQDASEGADPWQAPMQVGSQFIAALAAAKNLTPHRILGFGMIRSAAAQA